MALSCHLFLFGTKKRGEMDMHSRIIQVSKEPVTKDKYISEAFVPDWFYNTADYVIETESRIDEVERVEGYLKRRGAEFNTEEDNAYFIISDREKYFENDYRSFVNKLEELHKITDINSFIEPYGQVSSLLFKIDELYDPRFDFYVVYKEEFMTMASFMRTCDTGCKYYIGEILDYHC